MKKEYNFDCFIKVSKQLVGFIFQHQTVNQVDKELNIRGFRDLKTSAKKSCKWEPS